MRVNAKSNPLQNEFQFWCFLRYFPVFGVPRLPTIKAHKDRGQMVYMSPDGYYMGLVEGQSHRPSSSKSRPGSRTALHQRHGQRRSHGTGRSRANQRGQEHMDKIGDALGLSLAALGLSLALVALLA